jgi:predicted membrane protein
VFKAPLGLPEISIPIIILSSMFASIGFSILFRRQPKEKPHWEHSGRNFSQTTETIDDNNPYSKVNFGSSSKYLHSDCLKSGQFIASFGELEIFFDQAQLAPEGAEIFLDCSFGAIKLYVPKHWLVIDKMNVSLGGVENKNRMAMPTENAPRLTLTGNVQLGGIEIHYI